MFNKQPCCTSIHLPFHVQNLTSENMENAVSIPISTHPTLFCSFSVEGGAVKPGKVVKLS